MLGLPLCAKELHPTRCLLKYWEVSLEGCGLLCTSKFAFESAWMDLSLVGTPNSNSRGVPGLEIKDKEYEGDEELPSCAFM